MGLLIEIPQIIPELRYEHVHINKFIMDISKETSSVWKMQIEIIMYALLSDGSKKFNEGSRRVIEVNDLKQLIASGDIKLYNALQYFEQGMAEVLSSTSPELGNTTYYEG